MQLENMDCQLAVLEITLKNKNILKITKNRNNYCTLYNGFVV